MFNLKVISDVLYTLFIFLCVCLCILYILTRFKHVIYTLLSEPKSVLFTYKQIALSIFLGILICLASTNQFTIDVVDAKVNIRDSIAILAAVLGGPVVGTTVGLIGGIFRFGCGGWTAYGCGIATILIGYLSSLIVKHRKINVNNLNLKDVITFGILAFIFQIMHIQVIVPIVSHIQFLNHVSYAKPFLEGSWVLFTSIFLPMSFMNAFATFIFLLLVKDMITDNSFMQIEKQQEMIKTIEAAKNRMVNVNSTVNNESSILIESAQELERSSHNSVEFISRLSEAIEQISDGVTKQASEFQKITEKTANLSNSIQETSAASENIQHVSEATKNLSHHGLQAVEVLKSKSLETQRNIQTVGERIDSLNNMAKQIENIVATIKEIADQTNLLALNAAIEAARAGDAGKGFTIVAEEVTKLADQTANSTNKISKIINQILSEINKVVTAMENTKEIAAKQGQAVISTEKAFHEIAASIDAIAEKIAQETENLKSMDENKDQILYAMQTIAAVSVEEAASLQQVSASVVDVEKIVRMVSDLSQRLTQIAVNLKKTTEIDWEI